MNKIVTVSLFFRIMFQAFFVALPIILIIAWAQAPHAIILFDHGITIQVTPKQWPILHTLTPLTKVYGFLISLIPNGVILICLYFLIKLFGAFEKADFFSITNVRLIRNIGYTLLAGQILHPIYDVLMSLALTWHNPHGQRMIGITEQGTNVSIIIVALLIVLISWIMAEAHKLKEEQRLTV